MKMVVVDSDTKKIVMKLPKPLPDLAPKSMFGTKKITQRKVAHKKIDVDLSKQNPAQYRVHQRSIGSEYYYSLKEAREHIEEEIKEIFSVVRCIEWSMGEDTEIPYEITGVKIKLRQKKA